ncbi:hypothetical protein WME91_02450 [Sorangium sp. So ce269]
MNQNSNVTSSPSTQETQSGKKQGLLDEAKDAAGHVADQAREQVGTKLSSQKEKAAGTIGGIADAIRQTGDKLRDTGPLPDMADRAADGVERVANYLQTRNVGDIVREVERFARREPAVFFGAAFALGLVGGRFLKSSSRRGSQTGDTYQTWDAGRERDAGDYYGGYARRQEEYTPAYRQEREAPGGLASSSTYGQPDATSAQRAPSASTTSGTADKSSTGGASHAGTPSTSGARSTGYGATSGAGSTGYGATSGAGSTGYGATSGAGSTGYGATTGSTGQTGTSTQSTATNPGGSTPGSAGASNLGSANTLPGVGTETSGSRSGGSGRV